LERSRTDPTERRQREDGRRSRASILREAASLATVAGINGLSLSRLADEVGMSKSGIYAHFGSKEDLQLATIGVAEDVFAEDVLTPARDAEPGLDRLRAYCERYMDHVRKSVYPGGCFFASALTELDTQEGPVRDRALAFVEEWFGHLVAELEAAQRLGQISPDVNPQHIAFELQAFMFLANTQFVARGAPEALDLAMASIDGTLDRLREKAPAA
jgi:AcrR family transcriptional regulator